MQVNPDTLSGKETMSTLRPFSSNNSVMFGIGSIPTFDQQAQAGLTCNGVAATPKAGFQSCLPSQYSSSLVKIPAPRNLFDATVGKNNIFRADRYKLDLDVTAINLTNKYALYNFLSTFSGTHYVTPRALTAKITFNF
jgi:hypothetical protein